MMSADTSELQQAIAVPNDGQMALNSADPAYSSATSMAQTRPALDMMPDEVLLQIFMELDDPFYLVETSKRFASFSRATFDPVLCAAWLRSRYQPYEVIFRAIARPTLFDSKLLEQLMAGGAVLSRSLVQLLHLLHNESSLTGQSSTTWSSGLSFEAYLAVMSKGYELYGNISFERSHLDDCIFHDWLDWRMNTDAPPKVSTVVRNFKYMVLPLRLRYDVASSGRPSLLVEHSNPNIMDLIQRKVPSLVPLMRNNGYSNRSWCSLDDQADQGSRLSAQSQQLGTESLESARDSHELKLKRDYITDSFYEARPSLDAMPDDVMLEIWTLLDEPYRLALASKRYHLFGKDTYFRARWFSTRFPRYTSIFEAIARPALFTPALLEVLINNGAALSRHLVQLLHLLHNPAALTGQTYTRWGQGISFEAYLAIMYKAKQLYGEISFGASRLDEVMFMHSRNRQKMVQQYRFMPLPISFTPGEPDASRPQYLVKAQEFGMETACCAWPELGPSMHANGYVPSFQTSLGMCRKIFSQKQSSLDIAKSLQMLQDCQILEVLPPVAVNVIMGLRPLVGSVNASVASSDAIKAYDALIMLHKAGSLSFDLESVVRSIVACLKTGAVDVTLIPLLQKLDADFPSSIGLSSLFVQAMLIKAEVDQLEDLDLVSASMGRHVVTKEDVMQACLRNASTSTLPIQFAARFIDGFSMETFLTELIEALLNQPYRGKMLRELGRLAHFGSTTVAQSVFLDMLAEAVHSKAFTSTDVPAQHWSKASRQSDVKFSIDSSDCADSSSDTKKCRNTTRVQSLLSLDCKQYVPLRNVATIESHDRTVYRPDGLAGLASFTSFAKRELADRESHSLSAMDVDIDPSNESNADTSPAFTQRAHSKPLTPAELVSLQDTSHRPFATSQRWFPTVDQIKSFCERFQNLEGPMPEDAEAVAKVVIELLGTESRAADIVLSHSLVNRNEILTDELVEAGVRPTFEHFKIATKLNSPLPNSFLGYVSNGAPFKASFDSAENVSDSQWTYKDGLRNDVKLQCQAWAVEETLPRHLAIDIDDAGFLCIQQLELPYKAPRCIITRSQAPSIAAATVTGVLSHDELKPTTSLAPADSQQRTLEELPLGVQKSRQGRTSSSESGNDDAISSAEAQNVLFLLDGVPTVMARGACDLRVQSTQLWIQHLEKLLLFQKDVYAALTLAGFETESSGLADQLTRILSSFKAILPELKQAKPIPHDDKELLQELKELEEELVEAEKGKVTLQHIRALVRRKLKGEQGYEYDRRKAYNAASRMLRALAISNPRKRKYVLNGLPDPPDTVYDHECFQDETFEQISGSILAEGRSLAEAERVYLDKLLDKELDSLEEDFWTEDEHTGEEDVQGERSADEDNLMDIDDDSGAEEAQSEEEEFEGYAEHELW